MQYGHTTDPSQWHVTSRIIDVTASLISLPSFSGGSWLTRCYSRRPSRKSSTRVPCWIYSTAFGRCDDESSDDGVLLATYRASGTALEVFHDYPMTHHEIELTGWSVDPLDLPARFRVQALQSDWWAFESNSPESTFWFRGAKRAYTPPYNFQ